MGSTKVKGLNITRVEIIDHRSKMARRGRKEVHTIDDTVEDLELHFQDLGTTLKIFLQDKDDTGFISKDG